MNRTRLTVLAALAAMLTAWIAQPAGAQTSPPPLRVYVVVLDGLKPNEVGPLTPNLAELKDQGTWYEQARAVFPAETLPNHAAMMTGFPPQQSGIVGNDFWAPNVGGVEKYRMQYPNLLGADTLTTRLENSCTISSASVLSKGYLFGLFRGEPYTPDTAMPNNLDPNLPNPSHPGNQRQADLHWRPFGQPGYVGDPDDHAVDASVMNNAFLPWVRSAPAPPQFAFLSLGDIDRSGHIDGTGVAAPEGLSAARRAALTDSDAQVGMLIDELKGSGAWDETVLIFTSDHGMDWSPTDNAINQFSVNLTPTLGGAGYTQDSRGNPGVSQAGSNGDYQLVAGGGSIAVYVEEPPDVAPIAQIVDALPGVAFVATPTSIPALGNPTLAEMGMDHVNNGQIVAFPEKGFAVRDNSSFNPLPGNHGHPATQQSTLFVSGGSSVLDEQPQSVPGETVFAPAVRPFAPVAGGPGNLSVAPTVSALFGLADPGYPRGPLSDAFDPYALAAHTACEAGQPVGRVISIDDQTVTEGDAGTSDTTFTVSISPAPDVPISVNFATATGSAGAADFQSRSGRLDFPIGDGTETVTVPVVGDTTDEPNEEFFVDLANATSGTLVDSRGTGTIVDDDAAPQLQQPSQPPSPGGPTIQSKASCAGQKATVTRFFSDRLSGERLRRVPAPAAGRKRGQVTRAVGTAGDDVIVGTPANDVITGFGGNNLICGGGGDDLLLGNQGDDILRGNKGNDVVRGNGGPDRLFGNSGDDRLDGGRGTDRCLLGPGRDLSAPRSC